MNNNLLIKILVSLPIILAMLYFIPFLGVCLILLRYFMYNGRKKILTPVIIIGVGILILIPKGLQLINLELDMIPYLSDIIYSDLYNIDLINYSKFLLTVGVIFLIISFVLKTIFDKVSSKLNSMVGRYISETQRRDAEILRKNDMEIKLKQIKAKNTSYIKCPSCGADNLISDKFDSCIYCRSKLVNNSYK